MVAKGLLGPLSVLTGGADGFSEMIVKPIRNMLEDAGIKKESIDAVMKLIGVSDMKGEALRPLAVLVMAAAAYPSIYLSLMRTLGIVLNKPILASLRPADLEEDHLNELVKRRMKPGITDPKGDVKQEAIDKAIEEAQKALDDQYGHIGIPKESVKDRLEAAAPRLTAADWLSLRSRGLVTEIETKTGLITLGFRADAIPKLLTTITPSFGLGLVSEAINRGFTEKYDKAIDWYQREGLGDAEGLKLAKDMQWRMPNLDLIYQWIQRGIVTEADGRRLIKGLGFGNPILEPDIKATDLEVTGGDDKDIVRAMVRAAAWQLPTVTDLVQFAVKDVFDPKTTEAFKLFDEYPGDSKDAVDPLLTLPFKDVAPKVYKAKTIGKAFTALCDSIGVSQPHMRMQWAQHWNLPAPGQVFDMRFRGLIKDEDVDKYLKAADYSHFWREKMKGIQFNLPSRTDLEGMYERGVIDENNVKEGLEALGYSPQWAERLAFMIRRRIHADLVYDAIENVLSAYRRGEITKQEAEGYLQGISPSPDYTRHALAESETKRNIDLRLLKATGTVRQVEETRNVSRLDITRALKNDVITEKEAVSKLKEIGYDEGSAEFIVESQLFNQAIDKREERVKLIRNQYLARVIDIPEARRQLTISGLDTLTAEKHIKDMEFALMAQTNLDRRQDKPASVAELKRWLTRGLLTVERWTEEMRKTGVTDFVIAMTLDEITLDNMEPA